MDNDNESAADSRLSRRNLLKAGAVVTIAGISGVGLGTAQSEDDIELEIQAVEELVTIRNVSDSDIDLTGYYINFEAGEDSQADQIRQLAGEVIIGAGEEVTVATGAGDEGDFSLTDPYDGEVLDNEDPDVVALLDENENFVAASRGTSQYNDGDDETHTLTVVVTDTDGVRIEGAGVNLSTYDGGAEVGNGTTDEDGEVDFEVENGDYEALVSHDTLYQSSANRLVAVSGGDETFVVNLFDPDEEEGPQDENDVVEPEDGGDDDDSDESGDGDETDETDTEGEGDDDSDDDEDEDMDDTEADDDKEDKGEPEPKTNEQETDDCPKDD